MIYTAKITNRRPNPTTQHANGSHVCDVTCPGCEHTMAVTYGGWTGLHCGGCRATLRRTQNTTLPDTTPTIEDRDAAARHIDATEIAADVWVYLPDNVREHYTVTSEDLATLGRDLRLDIPDAYSLWCSVCGGESTDDEIAACFAVEIVGSAMSADDRADFSRDDWHEGISLLDFPAGLDCTPDTVELVLDHIQTQINAR